MIAFPITELIRHPEKLNSETLYELRLLVARYPYSQILRVLFLKNLYLLKDNNFGNELRKAALYVTDRSQLFRLLERDRYKVHASNLIEAETATVADKQSLDRTLDLIDAFLSTLSDEEVHATQSLDYVTDYTTYLLEQDDIEESEEDGKSMEGFELIDNYIAFNETENRVLPIVEENEKPQEHSAKDKVLEKVIEEPENDEEEFFTETLAKIYIKQQRYTKALEIIKKLSLKYPKKNAYFADQITHLEELIINTKSK